MNRPILLLITGLLLLAGSVSAQFNPALTHYHAYMNKGAIAKASGNIDSAIHWYRLALSTGSTYKPPYYIIGKLLVQKGAYKEGIAALENHVRLNGAAMEFEYLFDNYDAVKDKPEVVAFRKRLPALSQERKYMAGTEELERLVYRMLGMEQAMRKINNVSEIGDDSISIRDIRVLQCYVDTALTRPLLLEYVRAHGYPDTDSMDRDLGSAFNVIILHQLDYLDAGGLELDSIVRRAVYDGRYSPHQYLMTLDRRHSETTRKQLYGTYMNQHKDGSWYFDPPIDRLESVDARRAAWGLLPLKNIGISDWRNPSMPVGYKQ